MARDGLVPKRSVCRACIPRFKTPWISTILIGVVVAALTGLLPIDALLQLTNIGTLFAFVIVCSAVLVMRVVNPQAHRAIPLSRLFRSFRSWAFSVACC